MKPEDRHDVNLLNAASNGQHSGSRKRQRDEDNPREATRRTHRASGPSGPWNGMGQANLNSDRRQSNGKSSSTPSGNLIIQSWGKQNVHRGSLAHAAFPRPSLEGTLPDHMDPKAPSTSDYSVQSSHQSSPAQTPPFSGLSPETDDAMSGSLSLAQVLGDAEVPISPEPPKLQVSEGAISPSRSRSSSDPINLISPPAKPSGHTAAKPSSHTTAKPSSHATPAPIPVEDDSDEIEVEEVTPARSRPPPTTPKKQTPLRAGHVRETRAKFDQPKSQVQPTLEGYLGQTRPSQPGSSSRTAAAKTGPTSKGQQIIPGLTRQSARSPPGQLEFDVRPQIPQAAQQARANKRMGTKTKDSASTTQQSGLVVTSVGNRSQKPPSQASARSKEQGHKQPPISLKLPVQDWYCGNRHHTTGRKGKDPYTLTFTGNNLTLSRQGGALYILQGDLIGFEVAESNAGEASEFIPAVMFLFENEFTLSPQWKDYSGDDHDPRLLVYFDAQPENFTACWQELISRMARWTQKHIMTIDTMKNMIKYMGDRASSAKTTKQQEGPTLVAPAVQDDKHLSKQRRLPIESKARTSSPRTKPRTRSAVSTPSDEPHDPKPLVIHNPDEVMLLYPQSGTGAVTINRGELARLEPGEFLNDSLIELGLKMWLNDLRERDPTLADQIHVFSSFFFKKLDGGRGKGCEYDKVKKWTAKFDLFSKKFIIIPINEHLHWYLAIICFPEHTLKAPPPHVSAQPARVTRASDAAAAAKAAERQTSLESDMPNVDQSSTIDVEAGSPTEPGRMEVDNELADQSQKMAIDSVTPPEISSDAMNIDAKPDEDPSEPTILDMTNDDGDEKGASQPIADEKSQKTWILILDSLGGKHPRTVRLLREYLQSEALERRKAIVELKDARTSGGFVEDKHLPAPVQPNWCDCGVYLLHYVEVFHLNPLKILTLPPGAKRKSHPEFQQYEELWQTTQVKQKREAFRDKVHALSSAWLESKRSASKSDAPVAEPPKLQVTQGPPPLPNLEGDASLQIIEPPSPETISSTPPSLSSRPPRDGILPPGPAGPPAESSEGEVEDEVEILTLEPPASEESNTSRATRRGRKSGTRHGRQGSEVTQGSPEL